MDAAFRYCDGFNREWVERPRLQKEGRAYALLYCKGYARPRTIPFLRSNPWPRPCTLASNVPTTFPYIYHTRMLRCCGVGWCAAV